MSFFNGNDRRESSQSTSLTTLGTLMSPSNKSRKDRGLTIERPVIIVPSACESVFGSVIGARTATLPSFKEIGPPDLVHISKYNRQSQKEEGEYHFITGVDVSSEVTPVAYITTLNLNQTNGTLKHPTIFTYCSYNAISKCDVRIRVEFPGENGNTVHFQLIPSDRGNKILNEVTQKIWEELFVSAVVRSVIINQDRERKVPALIEKTLFQSKSQAKYIITAIVGYLDKGFLFGADSVVQRPSNRENFLLDTLYKVVELSGLYDFAIDLIKQKRDFSDLIIAKLLLKQDREVDAIRLLYNAIKANPRDSLLLTEQVKFLLSRNKGRLAYNTALKAVESNPISFEAWYYLVKSHILNDDISGALVSLNSLPMYGGRPKNYFDVNNKDKINRPFPTEGRVKSLWENDLREVFGYGSDNMINFVPIFEIQAVDPALLRINRQLLKGTHKKAYELLILIINRVGWDGLLKFRSEVFIMDEEYKNSSTLSLNSQPSKTVDFRKKRLCEKWLDDLFLILYEDLRVVLIVENELANQQQLKHSALEWELIGLTAYRSGHYKSAVASLRTTLSAKFDIVSACTLLRLWSERFFDRQFQVFNRYNKNGEFDITLDQLLEIVGKVISYNIRFYNEYQLDVLEFLKKLLSRFDTEYIKNKIQVLFENDDNNFKNSGVIPPFDMLVLFVETFK